MQEATSGAQPNAQGLVAAGSRALNDNRLDEAIQLLSDGVRADSGIGRAWLMLGIAYLRQGMPNDALTALGSAAHLRPSDATTRYFLGLAYQRSGHAAVAGEQFQFALQIDPNYHEARQALGSLGTQAMYSPASSMGAGPALQAQPAGPQVNNEAAATIMQQMDAELHERGENTKRMRRWLMIGGLCFVAMMAFSVMCIPVFVRSSRGLPSQVVREYLDAKYVRHDDEAARRLTVEGRSDALAYSELADMVTEQAMPIAELRSYVLSEATVQGNQAEIPVELDYVDGHGEVHQETVYFVVVALGPTWRVSLLQSMGGGGLEPEPPIQVLPVSPFGGSSSGGT